MMPLLNKVTAPVSLHRVFGRTNRVPVLRERRLTCCRNSPLKLHVVSTAMRVTRLRRLVRTSISLGAACHRGFRFPAMLSLDSDDWNRWEIQRRPNDDLKSATHAFINSECCIFLAALSHFY